MKKIIILANCLICLLFINCSKEDPIEENSNVPESPVEEENSTDIPVVITPENPLDVSKNPTEEVTIDIATLEGGLSIEGATLKTGTLTPNNLTSFSVEETEQSGFQDIGFEINLKVPINYAGAYLQLVDEDGTTVSDNYYDIANVYSSFKSINKSGTKSFLPEKQSGTNSSRSAKSLVDEVDTATIEVNFDDTIPAGSFCYYLCIYDTEGNISAPQTLCVEVEAWGGNSNLTGSWMFTKEVETEDGESVTTIVGEKDFYTYTETCNGNNEETTINEYNIIKSLILNLNGDGTQGYDYNTEHTFLIWSNFNETCVIGYDVYTDIASPKGNWAYDEEELKLTLVNYSWNSEETKNGEPYIDENDTDYLNTGIGFDLYVIKVSSTELVLEERYSDEYYNGSEFITEESTHKYYFTK